MPCSTCGGKSSKPVSMNPSGRNAANPFKISKPATVAKSFGSAKVKTNFKIGRGK